ncbi:MAG TPA: HNH endonuclease signature motif containing protein, partial [Planctomycetota bacterium]|nr:HNH endonuclease signature motif containing protein [Planctomycetota bacterium]
ANTRAKQLELEGCIAQEDVLAVWKKWDGRCWVCGDVAEELDHFRPINPEAGGTNTADNIRPICRDCNHKRSHRWHGKAKAMKEATLLKQLKDLLG